MEILRPILTTCPIKSNAIELGSQIKFPVDKGALLPHAFNVLLVDSEGPVRKIPWEHLRERDGWQKPPHTTNEQCQMMEAWLPS